MTHAGNTSETATVTVITSDGSFAFDVEATVQPVNNPVTPKFSNPLGIWASYIAFDIDVHSPTANVSGKIINTTTGSTLYTLNSSTLHNWNHPGVSTQHYGSGMGVLPANSNLSAVITVTNNGSYSGVYTFPFTTN